MSASASRRDNTDRSLARSAWESVDEIPLGLATPDHTVPYGTALLGWRCPRHFVPGYDRTVPPGHFATGFS